MSRRGANNDILLILKCMESLNSLGLLCNRLSSL